MRASPAAAADVAGERVAVQQTDRPARFAEVRGVDDKNGVRPRDMVQQPKPQCPAIDSMQARWRVPVACQTAHDVNPHAVVGQQRVPKAQYENTP